MWCLQKSRLGWSPSQQYQCRAVIRPRILRPAAASRHTNAEEQQKEEEKGRALPPEWMRSIPGLGTMVVAVASLVPALPTWAAEAFDPFSAETGLDSSMADTPHIFEALMFTLIMYFTIIMLWVWVSGFSDEPGSQENVGDQELPNGYSNYLHANIRSYNDPGERAAALQAQVCNAHNLDELKHGVAVQATEFLQQQIRDCSAQVRAKVMLAKRLGRPSKLDENINHLLASSSNRPIDRFIDDCISSMDLKLYSEPVLVRRVMRRVATKLAVDEVGRCLEQMRCRSASLQQQQLNSDPLLASHRLW